MAQIFLSYAREDEKKVENLYQKLSEAGFNPWMDKKDILAGERWEFAIQEAIRCSDLFLVCLSKASVEKRGWFQREIRKARDVSDGMLDSDIYLIPVLLEDCEAPGSLRDFQWVNLFEEDGWTRLVKAIQVGMERREEPTPGKEVATPEEGPERVQKPQATTSDVVEKTLMPADKLTDEQTGPTIGIITALQKEYASQALPSDSGEEDQGNQSLDTKILRTLYAYYLQHSGEPQMSLNELIATCKARRNDIMRCLLGLRERTWLEYDLTVKAETGVVWLTALGIRVAEDVYV